MDELNEIFSNSNSHITNNGHSTMRSTWEPTSMVLKPTPMGPSQSQNHGNLHTNLTSKICHSNENCFSDFNQDWEAIKALSNVSNSSYEGIPSTSANTLDQLLNSCEKYVIHFKQKLKKNILKMANILFSMTSNVDIPGPKAFSIPSTATNAISTEKVNATQLKFQNFDTELTEIISGLKSNLKRCFDDSPVDPDDDRSLLQIDHESFEPGSTEELTPIAQEEIVENHDILHIEMVKQTLNQTANFNKRLADVAIDLNTIRPHDIHGPRCILNDKLGLKIILNFAKDKPRADVAVLVITTTNQSHLPVKNYQFEASVSKVTF